MVKVKEKSELVTVLAGENLKKLMAKNFVRPTKHSILLPYFEELEPETDTNFQNIINGMMAAFLTENSIQAKEYTDMFAKHLRLFGLRMSKETFLDLVRFFYEVLIKKDQNRSLMKTACFGFGKMMTQIRNGTFGYRDLTLDWKPIYDLFLQALNNKIKPDISTNLNDVILSFAIFYHPEEHGKIWETLLQEIVIGSHLYMEQFMTICRIFLSVEGMSEEDVKKYCVDTWIKNLWDLYSKADMNTSWTSVCMEHISELCFFHPGAFDLSPYYDILFTKMMRSFELTVRGGKVSVGDGQEISSNSHLASICVYTIGGPNSSLAHFKRLMQYILVNVHPLNSGDHTDQIGSFLKDFLTQLKDRLKDERLKFKKRPCSKMYYLTDKDIDDVTEAVMDLAIMLLFSANYQDDYKLIHALTTINRELVAPKLLDHLYSSLTAVSEPHRLTVIIEAISTVIFEIIRLPDPAYRTPRLISYDVTWLKVLEEERKNWTTFQPGSEVTVDKISNLKAHAFYIMEIFVNHINMSDVDRTAFIFRTLITLFSSFPLIDFSISIDHFEMTNDERIICLLSKRVPHLVETTIEKLLDVITSLSVVIPKTSGVESGGGITDEKTLGDEEAVMKLGISQLVKVIFERVDDKMRKTLFDRLFAYLTTAEFANTLASELLSSLVSSAVWVSRDAFKHYAEFISKKLKLLITDDVTKTKIPSTSVLFYVELSRPLFAATHQMILENEQLLIEIIDLFLKCESAVIHKMGTHGVSNIISILLFIETEATASPENETFKKPLKEWNPLNYWAKCDEFKDTVIKWYIPAKPEIDCAQRFMNRFFFPYLKDLTEKQFDRDTLRRSLNHITKLVEDVDVFDHPDSLKTIPDDLTPYTLPIPSSSLGKSCILEYEMKGPNGENAREMIVKMVEKLGKEVQDPVSLIRLSTIAFGCLGKKKMRFDADIETFLTGVHSVLVDSTYGKATKASQHTMDQLAFIKNAQTQAFHEMETRKPNDFDKKIIDFLFDFALNDYEKVRSTALACLRENKSQIVRFRQIFIPKILKVLMEEEKNMDRLAGALNICLEMGWLNDPSPVIRSMIWNGLLYLKVFDDKKICDLFEAICKEIEGMNKNVTQRLGIRETHEDRNQALSKISSRLSTPNVFWSPYLTPDSLKTQTDVWFAHQNARHQKRQDLVEILFKNHILSNRKLHHTRENLAKSMCFLAQKEHFDDRSMAILLSQLNDEQYYCRKEAREWMTHWLYENKPKSVRMEMTSPERIDHGLEMESGIREDNVWICYDSKHLPDSEDKWNDTVFVDKEKGACRWARTLNVVRKRADGPPLLLKRITYSDRLIIDYFSQSDFISSILNSRIIEKEDHMLPNRSFYSIFKYVIRNYPDEKKPLELMTSELKRLLKSKKRNEQLLAAELFLGISQGLKHRPFSELDQFWKEITVSLDQFLHIMVLDAEPAWCITLSFVLSGDLRRNWWLVESLIQGARKTNGMTEFQQSFRLVALIFKRWRHGEIMKRVTVIAWDKLQTAVTDSLRFAIASVFCSTAQICEKNLTATLKNVPERFIPDSLDVTIQKILDKIPHLKLAENPESARNCHSDTSVLTSGAKKEPRPRRRSITEDLRDRLSLIHFRTLLETIIQYYDISMKSWSPSLVQILPKLMEYANEDDYEMSEETYRDVDITQNSAFIIHDYMSASWLRNEFIDSIVNSWLKTFSSHSDSFRVRLAVIKFVQASVYSNMYPMCLKSRREKVEQLLFKAIFDREISVRKEAAKCLLLFIHCEYIHIPDEKIDEFYRILHSKTGSEAMSHGAALALGALTLAFPFSLPINILKPLRILSSTTSKRAIVQQTMTESVREFRRQHRDDWMKTKKILGESLVYDIENATAPAYYA